MKFNEKLIELRKAQGLSQEEMGSKLGVSRQTISKWELGQSYPDFQRLVLISDYFGMSIDALVKDVEVQDVRKKNGDDRQLNAIYDDAQKAKRAVMIIVNGLAIFGIVGVAILLLIILIWGAA